MTWKKIYKGKVDSPVAILTADILTTDTTIPVNDASLLITDESVGYFTLKGVTPTETIKYTEMPVDNVFSNVVRGVEGIAQNHASGTIAIRRFTAKDQLDIIDATVELQGAVDTINGAMFKSADSDKLDGNDSTYYAQSTHTHDYSATYLGLTAKASDSELLDGIDSTGFVQTNDTRLTDARNPLPITVGGNTSDTLSVGMVVKAITPTIAGTLTWAIASPTTGILTSLMGIVKTVTPLEVAISKVVEIPTTAISVGMPVYLGTDGVLSDTSTGDVPKLLGYIIDATHLMLF